MIKATISHISNLLLMYKKKNPGTIGYPKVSKILLKKSQAELVLKHSKTVPVGTTEMKTSIIAHVEEYLFLYGFVC